MISDIQGTISNANRASYYVGPAAGEGFNTSLNAGVVSSGYQASELNSNLNAGVNTLNQQAGQLNQILNERFNTFNQHADTLNQNAANGFDAINSQVDPLNFSADRTAVEVLGDAVDAFANNSHFVDGTIALLAPSLKLFLDILGPLQFLIGVPYFTLALKTMSALQERDFQSQLLKEVRVTNATLRNIADGYREVELAGIVKNITRASMVYNESTNTTEAYFFYSQNNIAVQQLKGLKYFAYDTVSELFDKVFLWNTFANAATVSQETTDGTPLSKLVKRRTIIHFLDPCPRSSLVLSHIEFTDLYQTITIVNHHEARQNVKLESVKVHKGCSVQLEHVTVYKIDATHGGKATLRKCLVSWDQSLRSPVPFLFGGSPSEFENPYHVCGTVFCHECTTYDPTRLTDKISKRPSSKFLSCRGNLNNVRQETNTTVTIERTITNISDAVWHVDFEPGLDHVGNESVKAGFVSQYFAQDSTIVERLVANAAIRPNGDSVTFRVTCGAGLIASISGAFIFTDKKGAVYRHTYRGRSNLTDYTIASPTILGGDRDDFSFSTLPDEEQEIIISPSEMFDSFSPNQNNTILVVGRFGSGKSTFLNTLAGLYWKVESDGLGAQNFVANQGEVEKFPTSRSVKGCTVAAVARDITTFDGRDLTVIDTVGYDDAANDSSFYDTSNLTEVMDRYKEISAVVIVVNSQDPRLTRGFIESLACVPTSFKTQVQKNIILVFSKWTEDDEEQYGDLPDRGLTDQVNIIRAALGANEDDEIKSFWMENRRFKTYEKARRTIESMKSFLDHVDTMPRLSCPEFKEMRALSQFERVVRKEIREYFEPSGQNTRFRSGFEKFLFSRARHEAKNIQKLSIMDSSSGAWGNKLARVLLQVINNELPKEIQRMCDEAAIQVNLKSLHSLKGSILSPEIMEGYLSSGIIHAGVVASIAGAPFSLGISLAGIPVCLAAGYFHSKSWSRDEVIERVVLSISHDHSHELCSQITGQFSSYVDKKVEEIQKFFDSLDENT